MMRSTGILCPSSRHEGQKACAGADGVVSSPSVYSVDHTAILERKEATRTHPQPGTSPDFRGWVSMPENSTTPLSSGREHQGTASLPFPCGTALRGSALCEIRRKDNQRKTVTKNAGVLYNYPIIGEFVASAEDARAHRRNTA